MSTLAKRETAGTGVKSVAFAEDGLAVELMDGRAICAPLAWYPRLADAEPAQLARWEIAGGGYGVHWPDVDEDISTEGLLRGLPAPARLRAAAE